jgi:hypothetical protein
MNKLNYFDVGGMMKTLQIKFINNIFVYFWYLLNNLFPLFIKLFGEIFKEINK